MFIWLLLVKIAPRVSISNQVAKARLANSILIITRRVDIAYEDISAAMNIPKLAFNAGSSIPGLQIPQLQIPSLNQGVRKPRNDRISSPIIAATPVNELMNVACI
jgi:hypothetical protein